MTRLSHILLIAVFLVVCAGATSLAGNSSGAAFSTWPDTGQTKCYNATTEIPCPALGRSFYGQDAQYSGPARSYTLLGSGSMVRDNVTGLTWELKNNKDGVQDYSNPNDADNTILGAIQTRIPTVGYREDAAVTTLKPSSTSSTVAISVDTATGAYRISMNFTPWLITIDGNLPLIRSLPKALSRSLTGRLLPAQSIPPARCT